MTGRGTVILRARAKIEEMKKGRFRIVVSEIPYQVNKATLQEKIAERRGIEDRGIEKGREASQGSVSQLEFLSLGGKCIQHLAALDVDRLGRCQGQLESRNQRG